MSERTPGFKNFSVDVLAGELNAIKSSILCTHNRRLCCVPAPAHFLIMYLTVYYIPLRRNYKNRVGLSEKLIKQRLQKQGWEVWRGGAINILRMDEVYPNVRFRYQLLHHLLDKYHPKKREYLEYLCAVHHGMPDFICFRHGQFKFVECKLGHEQLSKRQKKCIPLLQKAGFEVEVHKIVEHCTKIREASLNITNGKKTIKARQLTLTKKLMS